jgi:hypothetical protein
MFIQFALIKVPLTNTDEVAKSFKKSSKILGQTFDGSLLGGNRAGGLQQAFLR